jgi:predicted phosphate transport protein (TIGR00153 family)
MFNLMPRDTVFYDLFEGISHHIVAAAEHLHRLATEFPHVEGVIQRIRNDEHAADEIAHAALKRLDSTFITPFDREDIHELVGGLDDIVDTVDALAKRFPLYHVQSMEPEFIEQTKVLIDATKATRDAVFLLRKSRKLADLSPKLIEIHRLENVGDDNNHAAMSRLFDGRTGPMEVMKWKELYEMIENAIDACEDVGNTLERIVLKNG